MKGEAAKSKYYDNREENGKWKCCCTSPVLEGRENSALAKVIEQMTEPIVVMPYTH